MGSCLRREAIGRLKTILPDQKKPMVDRSRTLRNNRRDKRCDGGQGELHFVGIGTRGFAFRVQGNVFVML
jgi:hypothetical protein